MLNSPRARPVELALQALSASNRGFSVHCSISHRFTQTPYRKDSLRASQYVSGVPTSSLVRFELDCVDPLSPIDEPLYRVCQLNLYVSARPPRARLLQYADFILL
jgi:hypothetical protein